MTGCEQSLKAPPVPPPDDSTPANFPAAVQKAKAENKFVLLEFTGSDWCPPCMKLRQEAIMQPAFQDYVKSNLIFLEVDQPRKTELPPAVGATNDILMGQFNIEAFPTLILVNGKGQTVWKNEGYIEGGPSAVISEIEQGKKQAPIKGK